MLTIMRFSIMTAVLAIAAQALGQTARVGTERGPHYVGHPVLVRIEVQGFDEEAQLLVPPGGGHPQAAVVTVPEVMAHAADSAYAPVRFSQPLPSGTEVEIIENRDPWSHIRLADGRDGWVYRSSMELVSPSFSAQKP